jgi:hypothetical protein
MSYDIESNCDAFAAQPGRECEPHIFSARQAVREKCAKTAGLIIQTRKTHHMPGKGLIAAQNGQAGLGFD